MPMTYPINERETLISTVLETILDIDLSGGAGLVTIEIANAAGGEALNACEAHIQAGAGATPVPFIGGSATSQWGTLDQHLLFQSATPVTLAAGAKATIIIDTQGAPRLLLKARTASGNATVTVRGTYK